MPFVRQALDADTQVARDDCAAIVDLFHKSSYVWPKDDLNDFNVVEHTAGNIVVSSGIITITGTAPTYGVNGIWRAAGGVPGFVKIVFSLRSAGASASTFVAQLNTGTGLINNVSSGRPLFNCANNTTGHFKNATEIAARSTLSTDTQYTLHLYYLGSSTYMCLQDGDKYLYSVNIGFDGYTTNPTVDIQNARLNSECYIHDYEENFGGFDTDSPTVDYVADAGDGKKWNNWDLTNFDFLYGLVSANATFQISYSDNATPSYGSELTLAQLNATGNLTGQYRYAALRVLQNSDGVTQCPVTEVNATDATDGLAPILIDTDTSPRFGVNGASVITTFDYKGGDVATVNLSGAVSTDATIAAQDTTTVTWTVPNIPSGSYKVTFTDTNGIKAYSSFMIQRVDDTVSRIMGIQPANANVGDPVYIYVVNPKPAGTNTIHIGAVPATISAEGWDTVTGYYKITVTNPSNNKGAFDVVLNKVVA
jgi:hypothetical protein